MTGMMIKVTLATACLLGQTADASPFTKREDNSLFDVETGKVDRQNVVQYFQDLGTDGSDSFDQAFAIVAYALTDNPDRLPLLFKSAGDRGYDLSCYEPLSHSQEVITINFEHAKKYAGDKDVALYKDHWWIAVLHGWMKEVWGDYYRPADDKPGEYQPWGQRGKTYDAFLTSYVGAQSAPWLYGDADLRAIHWIMSSLLKRNVMWSYPAHYLSEPINGDLGRSGAEPRLGARFFGDQNNSSAVLQEAVSHSPYVWVGPREAAVGGNLNPEVGSYVIQSVDGDEAQLANIKDGELDTKAPLKADAFWSNSQLPVVCGLENHLEEWGADWYERDAAPFRDKQDFELPPQTKLLKYSPEPTSP